MLEELRPTNPMQVGTAKGRIQELVEQCNVNEDEIEVWFIRDGCGQQSVQEKDKSSVSAYMKQLDMLPDRQLLSYGENRYPVVHIDLTEKGNGKVIVVVYDPDRGSLLP